MKHHHSLLITAPSGAGKTTLVKKLLADYPNFQFSVSCTTRELRSNEVNGIDYYFISLEEFKSRILTKDFIEWEEVYPGSYYGTLKSELQRIHDQNRVPIFDIDIMGAMSIKKIMNDEVLSVFIAPPNMKTLEERLRARHSETEEKIKLRLDKALSEMKFMNFFDKKIINDDLDRAYLELKNIVDAYLDRSPCLF